MTLLLLTELDSGEVLDKAESVGDEVVYGSGHAQPIVEGRARRLGVSDAQALRDLRNWTNGYVAFSPSPAPVAAHLKGRHNQESHGGDGVGGALDKLKLAGRIQLKPGEKLVASREARTANSSNNTLSVALTKLEGGQRQLRLGIVPNGKRWQGNDLGGTVLVGESEFGGLRTKLAAATQKGRDWARDYDTKADAIDSGELDAEYPESDPDIDDGVIAGGEWGDLAYKVAGTDVDRNGKATWMLELAVRPTDAGPDWDIYEDARDSTAELRGEHVDGLVQILDGLMSSDVRAAAGADVTPGNDELHHYWTKGEGLAKWATSAHPWTTLVRHLTKHVGRHKAEIFASKWFHEVFGIWPGERKGKNPVGPG